MGKKQPGKIQGVCYRDTIKCPGKWPGHFVAKRMLVHKNNKMKTAKSTRKRVFIIGGGFAGLNLARRLIKTKLYDITLIDKNNYNFFTPLLYQVATSFLEPSNICYPFRKIFRGKNITFRMASLQRIDATENKLYVSDGGELIYDHLVFAAGAKTNFYADENIRQNAYSIKDVDDALYFRNHLIRTLEKASLEKDPLARQKMLTIVIAGGGPTGVEVAGMFAEMKKYILGKDYPELKNAAMEIHVIDGAPHLLSAMSDKTHKEAYRALAQMGVHVKLSTHVLSYENDKVRLSDGEVIESTLLVWAAGVTANTFEGISEQSLGKGKRMITDAYNRVQGYENIFAIGDISIQFADSDYPVGHPQLAQPAIQQGKTLAKNLLRLAKGRPMKAFKYFDRGDMAIIGRRLAVADLFKQKLHLDGLPGLLGWLFIHLISLVNYNNKIKTFYNWAVAYLTQDQALRMIFRSGKRESRI
jgi:NADH dehydrogenase